MIIIITFLKRYWEQSQNGLFIQKLSGRPVFTVIFNDTSVVSVVSRYMLTYVLQTCVSATGCTNVRPQVKKMSHTFWIVLKNLIEKSNILGVCWGVFGHFESSSVKMQIGCCFHWGRKKIQETDSKLLWNFYRDIHCEMLVVLCPNQTFHHVFPPKKWFRDAICSLALQVLIAWF